MRDAIAIDEKQQSLLAATDALSRRSPIVCAESEQYLALATDVVYLKPNLLLRSAQLLLSFASSCRGTTPPIPTDQVITRLVEAVHQFMLQAKADGYQTYELLAARYLLSALLDDLIRHSEWALSVQWAQAGLLDEFAQEPIASGRFFQVLKRCCDDPVTHLDLLELGYYCLSLGFMGEYRGQPGGVQVIAQMRDRLYRLVTRFRGEPKAAFFSGESPNIPRRKRWLAKFFRARAVGVIWIVVTVTLALLYLPYQYHLRLFTQPIKQSLVSVFSEPATSLKQQKESL